MINSLGLGVCWNRQGIDSGTVLQIVMVVVFNVMVIRKGL